MINANAEVIAAPHGSTVRWNYLILVGEYAGCRFAAGEYGLQLGAKVAVKFHPDDQFAYLAPPAKPAYVQHGDVLTFQFSVPGFSQEQIDALVGEVLVQAEASDDHPEAFVVEPVAPSFDDAEDAGLDGTLRTTDTPYTWEEVARAALALLRKGADVGSAADGNFDVTHCCDDDCRKSGCDFRDNDECSSCGGTHIDVDCYGEPIEKDVP